VLGLRNRAPDYKTEATSRPHFSDEERISVPPCLFGEWSDRPRVNVSLRRAKAAVPVINIRRGASVEPVLGCWRCGFLAFERQPGLFPTGQALLVDFQLLRSKAER
jgi:hypothetical protein